MNSFREDLQRESAGVAWESVDWISFILHGFLVASASVMFVIGRTEGPPVVFAILATLGLALGYFLVRKGVKDEIVHLLALVTGIVVSLICSVAFMTGGSRLSDVPFSFLSRLVSSFPARPNGATEVTFPDRERFFASCVVIWLLAYTSAWMLQRAHRIYLAILMPCVFLIFGFMESPELAETVGLLFAVSVFVLLARKHARVKQQDWYEERMAAPAELSTRLSRAGSMVAVIALLIGSMAPGIQQPGLLDDVNTTIRDWWGAAQNEMLQIPPSRPRGEGEGFTFSDFENEFEVGGDWNPTKELALKLSGWSPENLVGRRYATYEGNSWISNEDGD